MEPQPQRCAQKDGVHHVVVWSNEYNHQFNRILADLVDVEAMVVRAHATVSGRLEISAPILFGRLHISPLIPKFMARYPDVSIDLRLTDRMINRPRRGRGFCDTHCPAWRLHTNCASVVVSETDGLREPQIPGPLRHTVAPKGIAKTSMPEAHRHRYRRVALSTCQEKSGRPRNRLFPIKRRRCQICVDVPARAFVSKTAFRYHWHTSGTKLAKGCP